MPLKTRAELKEYYKEGSKATEGQYEDLIDSLLNYVDDSAGIETPVPLGKTIFVDANAAPGGGVKGNIYRPYKNPQDALAAAAAGDTIVILPGIYTCSNLYRPGITYFAFPGVKIVNSGTDLALFSDLNFSAGVCRFFGKADFESDKTFIRMDKFTSEMVIECRSLNVPGISHEFSILGFNDNTISLIADSITSASRNSFVVSADSAFTIKAGLMEFTNTNYNGAVFSGVGKKLLLEVKDFRALQYSPISTSFPLIIISNPNATVNIRSTTITTTIGTLINGIANIYLDQVRFVTRTKVVGAVNLFGTITVKNSELILDELYNGQYGIGGQDLEIIGVLSSNMPLQPGTTFTGGEYNYDTNLTA